MQVVLIGAGNVGTVLGRTLLQKGHHILQVWSRSAAQAEQLGKELGTAHTHHLDAINTQADMYLLSVADGAIGEVAQKMPAVNGLVVHTAGAVPLSMLTANAKAYGVLWPMKMLRKTMASLGACTLVIDGNHASTLVTLRNFALSLSPVVAPANDAQRAKMHLLAAITSNFTNHLYHLAADYAATEGIDFHLFESLILETATQIQSASPANVQAGPAFRGDTGTIQKHLQLLQSRPQMLQVYEAMTASIRAQFGR